MTPSSTTAIRTRAIPSTLLRVCCRLSAAASCSCSPSLRLPLVLVPLLPLVLVPLSCCAATAPTCHCTALRPATALPYHCTALPVQQRLDRQRPGEGGCFNADCELLFQHSGTCTDCGTLCSSTASWAGAASFARPSGTSASWASLNEFAMCINGGSFGCESEPGYSGDGDMIFNEVDCSRWSDNALQPCI